MSKKRTVEAILDHNSNSDHPPSKKQRLDQQDSFQDTEQNKNKLLNNGEPIILNIGGIKYWTSLSTLSCDTNSILYKMFEGKFSLKPNKDNSYFIDRNGEYFKYILDYLRNNKLPSMQYNVNLINNLLFEAEFYNLSSLKRCLLHKKSGSKILKEGDIEFIQKCYKEEYKYYPNMNLEKSSLIHAGNMYPDHDKLKGLDCLLFLIQSKTDRFGFYIHSHYLSEQGVSGFLFNFDKNICGKRICIYKKYKQEFFVYSRTHDQSQNNNDLIFSFKWKEDEDNLDIKTMVTITECGNEYIEFEWRSNTVFNYGIIKQIEIFQIG